MDTEAVVTTEEVAPDKGIKPVKTPKTVAKPKAPTRTFEELQEVPAKKMTPAESVLFIEAMRAYANTLEKNLAYTKRNAENAYTMYRNADKAYNNLRTEAAEKLDYAKRLIEVVNESIHNIGALESPNTSFDAKNIYNTHKEA